MEVIVSGQQLLNKAHFWQECVYADWQEPITNMQNSIRNWAPVGTPVWCDTLYTQVKGVYEKLMPVAKAETVTLIPGVKFGDGHAGLRSMDDIERWPQVAEAVELATKICCTKRVLLDMEAVVQPFLRGDVKEINYVAMQEGLQMLPPRQYTWYHGVNGWYEWGNRCKEVLAKIFQVMPTRTRLTCNAFATQRWDYITQGQLEADSSFCNKLRMDNNITPHCMWLGRPNDWTIKTLPELTRRVAPYKYWFVYPGWILGPTVATELACILAKDFTVSKR